MLTNIEKMYLQIHKVMFVSLPQDILRVTLLKDSYSENTQHQDLLPGLLFKECPSESSQCCAIALRAPTIYDAVDV